MAKIEIITANEIEMHVDTVQDSNVDESSLEKPEFEALKASELNVSNRLTLVWTCNLKKNSYSTT